MDKIDWKKKYHQLEALCQQLSEKISALETENRNLREKLNTNSTNSSKPPSQDPFRKKNKKKTSGKKGGGQPGHPGHKRTLYPEEEVTTIITLKPIVCPACQFAQFGGAPISIECRQVLELPQIKPEVTQYNIYTCSCGHCGQHVRANVPVEAEKGFGPHLMGFLTMLSGQAGLTKRKICTLVAHLGIHVSLGALCKIHRLASVLLQESYEEIRQRVLQGVHINADETSWRTSNQRH